MRVGIGMALTARQPLSLVARAIAILRKYGTNAHIYLPGVGTLSGITAGNYLDSAGVTAASVDNPVGLSLDALQAMTLGSEKVTNGGFDADTDWTKGAGWGIGSGVASAAAATAFVGVRQAKTFTSGKAYLVTYTVVSVTSGACRPVFWGGAGVVGTDRTTAGTYSEILVALAASNELGISAAGAGFSGSVDNISVREIPGIHAAQATTSAKPILRLNSGKYSWQFDGSNDSLSLSAPLFQMADDHAVIAGFNAAALSKYVFSQGNSGTAAQCGSLRVDGSGFPGAVWIDDAAANTLLSGSASCLGSNIVAAAVKIGNAKRLRVNGVQSGATNNTVLGTTTLNSYSMGSLNGSSGNFQGLISPVIAIKGAVSDAELLVLERYVGMCCGVSI